MKNKLAVLLVLGFIASMPINANANNLSFDQPTYTGDIGSQINVAIAFDFSDEQMIVAWFAMHYNVDVLQLVSYTQAPLPQDAMPFLSPEGTLVAPGHYEPIGLGSGDFFSGMNSVGEIGTFTFEVIGQTSPGLSMTPCAQVICLTPYTDMDASYYFANWDGADVTDDFLPGGFLGAHVTSVPVPGALWLFVGALGLLSRVRRS